MGQPEPKIRFCGQQQRVEKCRRRRGGGVMAALESYAMAAFITP